MNPRVHLLIVAAALAFAPVARSIPDPFVIELGGSGWAGDSDQWEFSYNVDQPGWVQSKHIGGEIDARPLILVSRESGRGGRANMVVSIHADVSAQLGAENANIDEVRSAGVRSSLTVVDGSGNTLAFHRFGGLFGSPDLAKNFSLLLPIQLGEMVSFGFWVECAELNLSGVRVLDPANPAYFWANGWAGASITNISVTGVPDSTSSVLLLVGALGVMAAAARRFGCSRG